MKLYDFANSMSAFRVRMALNLKGIEYQTFSVDITVGEQFNPEFLALNPIAEVPCLVDGDTVLTQSMAIAEYLDERYPEPPLLPDIPKGRARVREISQLIACDIQPLHPGRVTKYLASEMGASDEMIKSWCVNWVTRGISALETFIETSSSTGKFSYGDTPTLADILLVSESYVAVNRFELDLKTSNPIVWGIYETCMAMPEFGDAAPDKVGKVGQRSSNQ